MRPARSATCASLESSTRAARLGERSITAATLESPAPRATPICSVSGPWFRNAIPSANASTTGKPNTQNTASGSR